MVNARWEAGFFQSRDAEVPFRCRSKRLSVRMSGYMSPSAKKSGLLLQYGFKGCMLAEASSLPLNRNLFLFMVVNVKGVLYALALWF